MNGSTGAWGLPRDAKAPSEIYLTAGNGVGSTGTKQFRFANTFINKGVDMRLVKSAVYGDSIVINNPGLYSITLVNTVNAATGVTKNSTQLTTNAGSLTDGSLLFIMGASAVSLTGSCVVNLVAGDTLRVSADGSVPNTSALLTTFRVTKISTAGA